MEFNMKKLLVALSVLTSATAFGNSLCTSLSECNDVRRTLGEEFRKQEAILNEQIDRLLVDAPVQLKKLKVTNSLSVAKKNCKEEGMRLPNARELAEFAIQLGAKGIKETRFPGASSDNVVVQEEVKEMAISGFKPVYKINKDEKVVDFYFNNAGYEPRGVKTSDYVTSVVSSTVVGHSLPIGTFTSVNTLDINKGSFISKELLSGNSYGNERLAITYCIKP